MSNLARIEVNVIVKPVWRKPFFKKGYTEYHVLRREIRHYNAASTYNAYSSEYDSMLKITLDLDEAVEFRDNMVEKGIVK